MKINKLNYEAYAIDYLEGNLEGEQLREMESFLDANPDIKDELAALNIIPLQADSVVVFPFKETLKKPVAAVTPRQKSLILFWGGLAAAFLCGSLMVYSFLSPDPVDPVNPVAIEKHTNNKEIPIQETITPKSVNPLPEEKPGIEIAQTAAPKTTKPIEVKKESSSAINNKKQITSKERILKEEANPEIAGQTENTEEQRIAKNPVEPVSPVTPQNSLAEAENQKLNKIPQPLPEITPEAESIPTTSKETLPAEVTASAEPASEPISSPTPEPAWNINPVDAQEETLALNDEYPEEDQNDEFGKLKKRKLFSKLRDKFSKDNLGKALLPEALVSAKD